jgi:hypothetical protein
MCRRFEEACWLRVPVQIVFCLGVSTAVRNSGVSLVTSTENQLDSEDKAVGSFEETRNTRPVARRHIPKVFNRYILCFLSGTNSNFEYRDIKCVPEV